MADARRLAELSMPTELAKETAAQIAAAQAAGTAAADPDNITIAAITAANFNFAGGTLTEALQALADAIPAA